MPRDRVAIVLPGGAEAALSFLAVAFVATSAALNPNYQQAEFEFYLSDLEAQALMTLASYQTPARSAAAQLGIPVIELSQPKVGSLPWFVLASPAGSSGEGPTLPSGQHTALVLHTSGTTARPKQVVLTYANLLNSAQNISRWLSLTPADRCLNIMPLFHIHGLMAALLASLEAVHAAGYLHLDLTPENVFVPAGAGCARLVDFGLVRPARGSNAQAATEQTAES